MSNIYIEKYSPFLFEKWNLFVENANNGTLFHRQDFLAYHREKFKQNEHHLVWYKGNQISAVLPLAIFTKDKTIAYSPYGGSYGGIVTLKSINYSDSKIISLSLVNYLQENRIDRIEMIFPISVISKKHSETLYLALLEQGFRIVNSDISSVVSMNSKDIEKDVFTSRARNIARKAKKMNTSVKFKASIEDFWEVMEKTFQKHKNNPTHTFTEWKWLCENLPNDVWCDVAYIDKKPIAGVGHFRVNSRTDSSFYLCSDPEFQKTQALSLLVYETILNSQKEGYEFFDFGTSSKDMVGRENIFRFKESFGAIGLFRDTYRWTR